MRIRIRVGESVLTARLEDSAAAQTRRSTDEPLESLGEKLALPPFLEKRRAQIEAGLKPL